MNFKKRLLVFCLIMCILFSISSISASDIDDEVIASEETNQIIEEVNEEDIISSSADENEEIITSSDDEETLSGTTINVDGNSFSDIQTAIDNANSGDTIKLQGTYTYEDGWGITIDTDKLTIDGGGNTVLDGNNKFRMITIGNGKDVVVKNIKFINGAGSYGGAIYIGYKNCVIDNCQFINCGGNDRGGAIYISDSGANITNCIFESCSSTVGGAIYLAEFSSGSAYNCQFEKCSATAGGIISATEQYASFNVYNSVFKNNPSPISTSESVKIFNDNDNTPTSKTNTTNPTTTKKLTPKLIAKKATFKVKTKIKKYSVILKTNKNKPMKKIKLYLKVKGKTYTAKTNSKGKATFKITKLKKKGTFKATIKFKGNKKYKKVSKTIKIKCK